VSKKDAPVAKRPRGRPSLWSQAICDEICERLGQGETLESICREEGMPKITTVHEWRERSESFSEGFARARARGFDAIAAQAMQIADTPQEGVEYITKADGSTEEKRGDMLGHRKLQIETRLKLLAKWDPKRYGERTVIAGDSDNPITLARVDISGATVEQLRALAALRLPNGTDRD
jgi:hypothetical protein